MLYSYECLKCGEKWDENKSVVERNNVDCKKCGVKATKLLSVQGEILTFHPAWFHDICEDSIYISSKGQLREECKKHDVLAARLM